MSINIKTASGLQKLTPEVNKSTISSALGYTPTDDTKLNEHKNNSAIHVTASDRTKWNNKSEFSGNYSDLIDKPNIVEDNSDNFTLTDDAGNKIFQVDSAGTHNLDVFIGPMDEEKSVSEHIEDSDIHITSAERATWNAKAEPDEVTALVEGLETRIGGAISSESDSWIIADKDGNKAFEVTSEGVTNAAKLSVGGKDLDTIIDEAIDADLGNVDNTSDINKPVSTAQQKALDDLKSTLSESIESDSNSWIIVDKDGNKALEVASDGVTNTAKLSVGGKDLSTIIDETIEADLGNVDNTSDINKPVSTAQQKALDDLKSTLSETIESESNSYVIADNSGNKAFEVDAEGITNVAKLTINGTDIEEALKIHTNNTTIHLTAEEKDKLATVNKRHVITVNEEGSTTTTYAEYYDLIKDPGLYNIIIQHQTNSIAGSGVSISNHIRKYEPTGYSIVHSEDTEFDSLLGEEGSGFFTHRFTALEDTTVYTCDIPLPINDDYEKVQAYPLEFTFGSYDIKRELDTHKADSVSHITKAERSTWNAKSDVKSYNDLPDAPDIAPEDNEDRLVITDSTGNIVLKAGELDEETTGLETTTIKAQTANIDNLYTKIEIDAIIAEIEAIPDSEIIALFS